MPRTTEYAFDMMLAAINPDNYTSEVELEDAAPSLDTVVGRRLAYERLSDEAKRVIAVIINAPEEVLETIAKDGRGGWSRRKVERHFCRKWGSKKRAHRVVEEIRAFVNSFLV
jgi:hypothetical protein